MILDLDLFGQPDPANPGELDDLGALEMSAELARWGHVPMICSVDHLRARELEQGNTSEDQAAGMDDDEDHLDSRWTRLRNAPASRYICLCGQRLLLDEAGLATTEPQWVSSAVAVGELLIDSLARFRCGWHLVSGERTLPYSELDVAVDPERAADNGMLAFTLGERGPRISRPVTLYRPPAFECGSPGPEETIWRHAAITSFTGTLLQHAKLLCLWHIRRLDTVEAAEARLEEVLSGYARLLEESYPHESPFDPPFVLSAKVIGEHRWQWEVEISFETPFLYEGQRALWTERARFDKLH